MTKDTWDFTTKDNDGTLIASGTGPFAKVAFRLNGLDTANVSGTTVPAHTLSPFTSLNISVANEHITSHRCRVATTPHSTPSRQQSRVVSNAALPHHPDHKVR